jgi:hypothetical protein
MTQPESLLTLLQPLRLPQPDLARLSFCASNKPAHVAAWAAQLPVTRVSYSSALLYKALPEVCRLQVPPDQRLAILECLHPYAQQAISGLARHYLGKPLMLPEGAMKSAVVSQALQKHLANGYLLCARDFILQPKAAQADNLTLALHRAMAGLGHQLLLSAQLYTSPPPQLWLQAHTTYRLAEALDMHQQALPDPGLSSRSNISTHQIYLRMLLLHCANPSQLTQPDILRVHEALEDWVQLATLNNSPTAGDIYAISAGANSPPIYIPFATNTTHPTLRYLHLTRLTDAMEKVAQGAYDATLKIPVGLNTATLEHCLSRWQSRHERQLQRQPTHGMVEVVVGLTAIHARLSASNPLPAFAGSHIPISGQARFDARILSHEVDPWAEAFDASGAGNGSGGPLTYRTADPATASERDAGGQPSFQVDLIDSSHGGFCLQWQSEMPAQVRAGELLAVRSHPQSAWILCVIRWARQVRGASQLGLQILAHGAEPLAAQVINKSGQNSEFLRVLRLHNAPQSGQERTLLTAALPFRRQHKVNLIGPQGKSLVQLTDSLIATSCINHFSFRVLEDTQPTTAPAAGW